MKFLMSHLFVVTLVVCLSFKHATCLRCYECHNFPSDVNDHSTCTKLDPSMIRTCPESDASNKYVCRKFTFQPLSTEVTYIKRSCGKLEHENIEEFYGAKNEVRTLKEGTPVTSMICNTDLCNGAGDNSFNKLILLLCAILSVSFYKYVY